MVGAYLRYFTFLSHDEILGLDEATGSRPEQRLAQRELARQVCTLVHGEAETERAEQAAAALFSEDIAHLDEQSILDVFAEAPSTRVPRARLDGPGMPLVDLLVDTGLVASKGKARTTIEQGWAYVNNRRADDVDRAIHADDLVAGRYLVLRRGKRDYHLVHFG